MQGWQLYQRALLKLKQWAKCRHIDCNALGYLGGYTWSILLADTMLKCFPIFEDEPSDVEDKLVTATCKRFASWPWPKPVSLALRGADAPQQNCDLMPILCISEPHANSARNVTASTRAVLLLEMQRKVSGDTKPPLYGCQAVVRCQVLMSDPARASCAAHWLEARLLALVKKLDHVNARPICLAPGLYVVGTSAEPSCLEQAANDFRELLVQDDRDGDGWSDVIEVHVDDRESLNQCVQAIRKPSKGLQKRSSNPT